MSVAGGKCDTPQALVERPRMAGDREQWPPEIVVQSSREANVKTK